MRGAGLPALASRPDSSYNTRVRRATSRAFRRRVGGQARGLAARKRVPQKARFAGAGYSLHD